MTNLTHAHISRTHTHATNLPPFLDALHADKTPTMRHLQEAIAQAAQALEHARFQEKTALQLCSGGGGGGGGGEGVKTPPSP